MPDSARHPFVVGDILISSWDVQQSTVDFYQVIRISPKTVVVRRVDARVVEIVGAVDAIVEAVPDAFRDEEQRRRPRIETGEWGGGCGELGASNALGWDDDADGAVRVKRRIKCRRERRRRCPTPNSETIGPRL